MNLIVDVGNTRTKLAVFEQSKLVHLVTATKEDLISNLESLFQSYPTLKKAMVSAVGAFSKDALQLLQDTLEVYQLTKDTLVPFINTYQTPATLGVDRIALISAAAVQFPNKNVLVVDAGSCITYDFLTAENRYIGGGISPGLTMRYKSLHAFTKNLPLLTASVPTNAIGITTESAMHSGVFFGVQNEIDGFIKFYRDKFPDFTIILTGGDAHLLRDSLKNSIFAIPNFLLEGLDHILEYNS